MRHSLTPEEGLLVCFCRIALLWHRWPAMRDNQVRLARHLSGLALAPKTCGHQLTESEFEYYENRRHLDRLCKRCAMEERAR